MLIMSSTFHRSAHITVELPREQAMALFTPDGEGRWAEGWDPRYPEPSRREGPGTVFMTGHADRETTWIMVDQRPDRIRYARVIQDMTAGTVAVEAIGSLEHSTQVRVTYDLTALSSAGERWLESFSADYDTSIGAWSTDIQAALKRRADGKAESPPSAVHRK